MSVFLFPSVVDASPSQGCPPPLNSLVPIYTPGWREALCASDLLQFINSNLMLTGNSLVTARLYSSSGQSPQATCFCLRATRKAHLVARLGNFLLRFNLEIKNSLTKICLSLLDFLCCIDLPMDWFNV